MTASVVEAIYVPLRLVHDLREGESRGLDVQGCGRDTVLVVRHRGCLHAYEDRCPHLDTPMAWRKDAYLDGPRTRIVCAAHGAQFDIETGECLLGPCLGQALMRVRIFDDSPSGLESTSPCEATVPALTVLGLALAMLIPT